LEKKAGIEIQKTGQKGKAANVSDNKKNFTHSLEISKPAIRRLMSAITKP